MQMPTTPARYIFIRRSTRPFGPCDSPIVISEVIAVVDSLEDVVWKIDDDYYSLEPRLQTEAVFQTYSGFVIRGEDRVHLCYENNDGVLVHFNGEPSVVEVCEMLADKLGAKVFMQK